MTARILTWNLQGRERPDLGAVAAEIRRIGPDVVLLQEVQRRQARSIARDLGLHLAWRLKHWPVVLPAEGLAILTPEPPASVDRLVLSHGWRFWSSNRRIAVAATVPSGDGTLRVVDTHLGAGVGDTERSRQAGLVADLAGRDGIVGGDLNTAPGSTVLDVFRDAGLRDAWAEARPGDPGPTNWRPGPRHGPPVQRLDYVLVGSELRVRSGEVPSFGDPGFERYGSLSDHLPLTVTIEAT